jgi:sugar/nucleoside kinase (ribokinase family)
MSAPSRNGIRAGGNWIVDHVKLIDRWPPEDALVRIRSETRSNGGSPYNLLKNLAKLGAPFPLEAVGLVGDDDYGRFIRADCARHGIDATDLHVSRELPTSYTDVMTVRETGRRTFFHQAGASAHLAPDHFDFTRTGTRHLHLGYALLLDALDELRDGSPRARGVLARARAAGLTTSLDCVSEHSDRFQTIVLPLLPEVDLVFANEFELAKLTGAVLERDGRIDPALIAAAAGRLLDHGVRAWVVIHFPSAVYARSPDGREFWQPSLMIPPSAIAGAAGAGDALAAGILLGWHEGWTMPECLRLGVCAAAASLQHPSCSESVGRMAECLALGERYGFRPLPA